MTVQALALITVTDRETLTTYRDQAADALAKHGGALLTVDPSPVVLETVGETPDVTALLSFPTEDAAHAWINDPALADIHALRNKGGNSTIVMIPG